MHQVDSLKGLDAFRNGFWINAELDYTYGQDSKYWIPPNMIQFIQKTKVTLL